MKERDQEEKRKYMTEAPVEKLVCSLAAPTITSMLVTAFYNMADTFFVGKISTSATGAVGVVFSLMAIIQAVGFTFGQGSGNYISRKLGMDDMDRASRMASTAFFSALAIGGVITLLGLLFLDPLVRVLGATDTILPHARSYARLILLGAPYMVASFVLNNQLRFQGSAFYGMIGVGAGALLNIALDPLFIFVLDMGVAGAALATIISQLVGFFLLLAGCTKGGNIRIRISHFTFKWEYYYEILRGGLPSFYRQGLASLASICMNLAAGVYGDAAIAAMSIVNRVMNFAGSAVIGFGQGFQPVCGFNYGAGLYERVKRAFWFCVKTSVGVLIALAVAGFLFAPQIVAIFRKEDAEVIAIGALALRIQCVTFPLMSWITLSNMMMQNIGKAAKASVLAMARQGIFYLPAILILPAFLQLNGILLSQPVADIATFLLALPMEISVLKELQEHTKHA